MPSYKSTLQKLFCLEGLLLNRVEEINKETINLKMRSPRLYALCPRCQKSTSRVHRKAFRMIKHMIFKD